MWWNLKLCILNVYNRRMGHIWSTEFFGDNVIDTVIYNVNNLCFQHTTTVNQISIDENGDYLASCSDDGRVMILL